MNHNNIKNKENKSCKRLLFILALASFAFIILLFSIASISASAYNLVCLGKGGKVEFSKCNPSIKDYICTSTSCNICASICPNGAYGPASPNKCNALGLSCTYIDGSVDQQPPILTILNPEEGNVYNSKALLLSLEADEIVSISYAYPDSRGRWSPICTKCTSHNGKRSFKEGNNNLTFRARDLFGNTAYFNRSFIVDSQKPRISKTLPSGGFTASDFYLEFKETNPASLIFNYGNDISGRKSLPFNINSDCIQDSKDKTKYKCSRYVNVEEYDSEKIQYNFNLTDIAGNSFISKIINLNIDTSPPVINSLEHYIKSRTVTFIMNVTELNFDNIEYIDNSALRPMWRILCSSLSKGICKKSLSFSIGHHNLDIQVTDDAGNTVAQPVSFDIV